VNARLQQLAPPWAPLAATVAVLVTGTIARLVWHSDRLGGADAWGVRELEATSSAVLLAARIVSAGLLSLALVGSLAVAALAWVVLRWRKAVLLALAAPVLAVVAERLLKLVVERRVPEAEVSHYPSGHLAAGTAFALSLVLVVRRTGVAPAARTAVAVAACLFVVVMGVARVVESAHLLSDVVGGVGTGGAVTLTAALLLDRARARGEPPGY
jgi:membrane-associated phospholipid phosphatase